MVSRKSSTSSNARSRAGRKGAEARWGLSTSSRSSRSGRTQTASKSRSTTGRQTAGSRGGRAASQKLGSEFFRDIGRKGGSR